jgi:hypothetical protein
MKTAEFKPLSSLKKLSIKPLSKVINKLEFNIKYPTINPILKYRLWDKVAPSFRTGKLTLGKPIGMIKSTRIGRVVPITRWEALATGDVALTNKIKDLLETKPRAEAISTLKEQQMTQVPKSVYYSSRGFAPKISASYPSSYTYSLASISRTSRISSPSNNYSRSYELSRAISSLISSPATSRVSKSVTSRLSYPEYSYLTETSYSPPSYPRKTPSSSPKPFSHGDKVREAVKKAFKSTPQREALMPDFTARALGIAPKKVSSVKEALREIGKIQTGFEIRTGATFSNPLKNKIKNKGMSDRELMKGVMAW